MKTYTKYHGLGNDYIVMNVCDFVEEEEFIRRVCHRNLGIGSDGILVGPYMDSTYPRLRIFNPDGSEAEKSGNGLRIFARYLWEEGVVEENPFCIETKGGNVTCWIDKNMVIVDMGTLTFESQKIPVLGEPREVIREELKIEGETFLFCAANIGNPHCVIFDESPSAEKARKYGPLVEKNPIFPQRINVQFMSVMDRKNIQIEIWERGAGYTLASGSSSVASAGVAYKLGHCDTQIDVHMPGGVMHITFDENFRASLRGPVTCICQGIMSREMFT